MCSYCREAISQYWNHCKRGRLDAPGVFNTSYDILRHQTGGVSYQHMDDLDQRFWNAFKKANFINTTFGLSYMKDEDMDSKAYDQLVEHLCYTGAKILSKGTSGRHNDDTDTNVAWFLHFYNMVLREELGEVTYDNQSERTYHWGEVKGTSMYGSKITYHQDQHICYIIP